MPRHRERILEFLARSPARDDDEIASALGIVPRQTVNIVCRKLRDEGLLRRERGRDGKLVNILNESGRPSDPPPPEPPRAPARGSESRLHSEDEVKAALALMLSVQGWSADIKWGKERGIDIVATRGQERWVIECKGEGSLAPMQNNYFVGVIGELAQRMSDESAKHSIALPDTTKFRRLWSELPPTFKQRLKVTALFVSRNGQITELTD